MPSGAKLHKTQTTHSLDGMGLGDGRSAFFLYPLASHIQGLSCPTFQSEFSLTFFLNLIAGFTRNIPEQVKELENITDITTKGWLHSFALKPDGTIWTWGDKRFGQPGDDTYKDKMRQQRCKTPI